MEKDKIIEEIIKLKKEKNAVILAHNYQIGDIQDIADFVGDSFKLSQVASSTEAEVIVFCGVHFMAESAKILSPEKKVLLPVIDAGCPMADMITAERLIDFKKKYPGVPVVCYVNSSAEVKGESDICCTSSNAVKVVRSLDSDKVIFVPDRNLGNYVAKMVPEKEIICWEGFCRVHNDVQTEEIANIRTQYPGVKILIHPECRPDVVREADFVGSTSQIIEYVSNSGDSKFIIGTEEGILHTLKKENPEKDFIMLSSRLLCEDMKKTKLLDLYNSIKEEKYEIILDKEVMEKAHKSLDRMLAIS